MMNTNWRQKVFIDRDRTRTCNPQIRSLMPYPLGHTAGRQERTTNIAYGYSIELSSYVRLYGVLFIGSAQQKENQ